MAEQELASTNGSSPQSSDPKTTSSELQSAEQELNAQERLFCYEYLVDFDHRRAATVISRSPDSGKKLLRNPKIARFIKLLSDELAAESLISSDMVQYELLHEFLPRAKGEKPIEGVDRDGVQWSGKVTNMAAYGKALDLMAKHSGFNAAEVVKGGLTININHKAMGITVEGEYSEQGNGTEEIADEGQS